MATGIVQPTAPDEQRSQADQVIDHQLSRVRRHIRLTDLVAGLMNLAAGTLAFLIVAAVVDHWIFGLGVPGRLLALLSILGWASWYFATRLVPVLLRPINPAYAAQTIERGELGLNNSLLNYLLLRRERALMHRIVFDALQRRAAFDVSRIEVDQSVDRTPMIHAGYVLVAIMSVAAAYKILSPKDPLQTAHRIVSPWADIARPARVTIESVAPGDSEFFHGQTVEVSAIVHGAGKQEKVHLLYSTLDGQTVDRQIEMKLDSGGLRHNAMLPPDGGLRQDIEYRLLAGDGATRPFHIRVVAAPRIEVESVEYEYPRYTKRPPERVERQGDLKAVEGTRVTIRARTNQPIRTATLEFDPRGALPTAAGNQPTPASARLPMDSQDTEASRSFYLELSPDRQTPRHEAYALTFINATGTASNSPVIHRIQVTPDLSPEVEFLTPRRDRIDVPLSGRQKIEVRAIDPDYGLSQLRLRATRGNMELLDHNLLETPDGQTGQVVASYDFRPLDLDLAVGDQVTCWAVAEDNRSAVGGDSPQPNTARTRNVQLVVVADPKSRRVAGENEPDDGKGEAKSASQPADPTPGKPGVKRPPDRSPQVQPQNDSPPQEPEPVNKKPSDYPSTNGQQPSGQQSSGQDGQSQGSKPQSETSKSGDGQQGEQGTEQGQQPDGERGETQGSGAPQGAGQQGQPAGNERGADDGPGGTSPSTGDGSTGSGEQRQRQPGGERGEPLHDGDVFERALRRMQERQQPPGGTGEGTEPGQSDPRQSDPGKRDFGEPKRGEAAKGAQTNKNSQNTQNGESPKSDQGTRKKPAPGKQSPEQTSPEQTSPEQTSPEKPAPGGKDGQGAETVREKGAPHPDGDQGAGQERTGTPGEAGKTAQGGMERPDQAQSQKQPPAQDGDKKPGLGNNGESGAGENSQDKTGSANVDRSQEEPGDNRDRPKQLQPDGQEPQEPGDPGANASNKQSDSQGAQSGDQSGGGKKGPGQGAKQPGNDSAGSNSSSDDGAGQSKESGQGETSASGGDKQQSGSPTGAAGKEQGPGSRAKPAPDGQPTADGGEPATGDPPSGGENRPPGKDNQQRGGTRNGSRGAPAEGGLPGDRDSGAPPSNEEVAAGDAANMDYARRATDMVLDYLRNQQDDPDRRLLDELGWSPDDMRKFLTRWQQLKQGASEDAALGRELDESLRSLGLRPSRDARRAGTARTDDLRGLRESGEVSVPPSSYQEKYKRFQKGSSRGSPLK